MTDKKLKKEVEKRHKCSICGKVRFEKFMKKICYSFNGDVVITTRYGNACWFCSDKKSCVEGAKNFFTY